MSPRRGRRPASAVITEGDTRERLIRAARQCFARYGYDRTTNADIAEAANITTGAIYHYFDSKADLFTAAAEEVVNIVLAGLRVAAEGADTTVDKLHRMMDAAVMMSEQGDEDLARFAAIAPVELERRKEFRSLHQSLFKATVAFFEELIEEGKRRGEVAPDVSSRAVADLLLATSLGIALQAGLYRDLISLRDVMGAFQGLIEGQIFTKTVKTGARRARKVRARSIAR